MKQLSLFALADPIAKMLGSWSVELTTYSILLRLVTVIILTSIIGCERSSKRHSAGLRTFVLVSFSSCVAMILDLYLMQEYRIGLPLLSTATIISAAMLSGNSIIFSSRSQIKGLTTSAALWFCGFLGFVIGAGQYTLSIIVYVLFLCILTWFPSIEVYLNNRSNHFEIHLELKNSNYLRDFVTVSRQLGLRIDDIEVIRLTGADVVRHKLVGKIITAFENNKAAPGQPAEKKPGQPTQKPAYRNNNRFARKK